MANIRHAHGEGKEITTRPIVSEEAKEEEEATAQAAMDEAEENMIANVARSRCSGSFAPLVQGREGWEEGRSGAGRYNTVRSGAG